MKKIIAIIAIALSLAACGQQQAPLPSYDGVQGAPAPVAQHDGFDTGDAAVGALAGAAAGYMMGKGSSNNRTIVVDNRRPTNYGYNDYRRSRNTVTTTTVTKRSAFGGSKTVTRTTRSRR
jgi:hypothetical protein